MKTSSVIKDWRLCALALVLLTFSVWSVSLWNGFVWDDHILIEKNETALSNWSFNSVFFSDFWTTETEQGKSNYYRPLVSLSYIFDYAVYRMWPVGFHITNLILHLSNVLLVFAVLTALAMAPGVSTAGAAIFAIHPALAESVAWVSGRTDLLATFFILLSVYSYLLVGGSKIRASLVRAISVMAFAGGVLSKESAVVTPFVIFALCAASGKKSRIRIPEFAGYLIVFLIWMYLRSSVLKNSLGVTDGPGVTMQIGVLSALHLWGNIIWPLAFRIEYGSALTAPTLLPGAIAGALVVAFAVYLIVAKSTPSTAKRLIASAFILFIPSLAAIFIKSIIGLRLLYATACFLIPALVLAGLLRLTRPVRSIFFATLLVFFSLLSFNRAKLWRSDVTLFEAALAAPDASSRGHLNLGIAYYDDGKINLGLQHLTREIELAAADQQHYMLGLIYTALKCETSAEKEYKLSLSFKPGNYSALHNLSGLFASQGRITEARDVLIDCVQKYPESREGCRSQIAILDKLAPKLVRAPEERTWCSEQAELAALLSSPAALNRMANALLKERQLDMAEVFIKATLALDRNFVAADLNYAQLKFLKGDKPGAINLLEETLRRHPTETRASQLLEKFSRPAVADQ